MRPTEIHSELRGDALFLSITGPLTVGGGDLKLGSGLARALAAGCREIVLDFTLLSSLDSSGLGELMRARTAVGASGGRMVWAGCPRTMLDVLDITRVDLADVEFAESVDEALGRPS